MEYYLENFASNPFDDIGDRCSYTWNLLQSVLRNKPIERDGKRGKTIRRAGIGLGALGFPPRSDERCVNSRSDTLGIALGLVHIDTTSLRVRLRYGASSTISWHPR
jgi:hypothetical protein